MYNSGRKWERVEMFYGNKELSIDEKSRLLLPSIYRDQLLGGKVFACYGLDGCIELYPESCYLKKVERYSSLDDFSADARKIKRTFFSNSFELNVDGHNRILLPKPLIDKTQTSKKVVVVGVFDHLEIWDQDKYIENSLEDDKNFATNASRLVS